jgi:hypothetical protein
MSTSSEFPNRVEAASTVLEEPAPAFSIAQAEEIAHWALDLRASAHPLASERDASPASGPRDLQ